MSLSTHSSCSCDQRAVLALNDRGLPETIVLNHEPKVTQTGTTRAKRRLSMHGLEYRCPRRFRHAVFRLLVVRRERLVSMLCPRWKIRCKTLRRMRVLHNQALLCVLPLQQHLRGGIPAQSSPAESDLHEMSPCWAKLSSALLGYPTMPQNVRNPRYSPIFIRIRPFSSHFAKGVTGQPAHGGRCACTRAFGSVEGRHGVQNGCHHQICTSRVRDTSFAPRISSLCPISWFPPAQHNQSGCLPPTEMPRLTAVFLSFPSFFCAQ